MILVSRLLYAFIPDRQRLVVVLLLKADRAHGHYFLHAAKKVETNHSAPRLSSFNNAHLVVDRRQMGPGWTM